MGLFSKNEEEEKARKEARAEKRKQNEEEYKKRNDYLRGKPLKEQFLFLASRKEFWGMIIVIILGIALIVVKHLLGF